MKSQFVTNNYGRFDLTFDRGEGCYLYDESGKAYLDFAAGIAVNSLGHCHPAMVETIIDQANRLWHISNLYWNSNQNKLAEMLVNLSGLSKVSFSNSGTEANETALKIARKHGFMVSPGKKNKIVYMRESFHGRTMGALSVTGQEKYREKFRPLPEGVVEAEFNDLDSVARVMDENVCGIIVEPIQGESGILPATKEFLQGLKDLCLKFNALLIFDEVQCGIGRTGEVFAFQDYGVQPDVLSLAKGLAAGFPIGATVVGPRAENIFEPGDHGCTFGGNPLACACSLTVLSIVSTQETLASVKKNGEYLLSRLNSLGEKYSTIELVRGQGLIVGIKMKEAPATIISQCIEEGLLLVGAGGNVIRMVPPLTVSWEEIDQALEIFEKVLKKN